MAKQLEISIEEIAGSITRSNEELFKSIMKGEGKETTYEQPIPRAKDSEGSTDA